MESDLNLNDFEYTISDSDGFRGVKDGKEYPITEEEWQRIHPEHRNTECKECAFVQDVQTLLTFMVPREKKEQVGSRPEFVGKFTMLNWTGHSSFYLFRCGGCDTVVVDYPHGYRGNFMYLRCDKCRGETILKSKEIYERDKLFVPVVLRPRKEHWKFAKRTAEALEGLGKIENMGVRTMVVNGNESSETLSKRIRNFF